MSARFLRRPRRGVALVVVLAILAACVVLSVVFLQAQATALQVARNADAADKARRAAESGLAHAFGDLQSPSWAGVGTVLAAALSDLQGPTWAGVGTVLAAEVGRNDGGVWSYRATVTAATGDGSTDAAMRVTVTSVGGYLPAGSSRPVERTLEAALRLVPRVPVSLAAAPSDRKPDAAWDPVQRYAFFGDDGADTLKLPPQAKLVGDVYSYEKVKPWAEVGWDDATRARVGAERPAPITGFLEVYKSLASAETAGLNAMLGSDKWGYTATLRTLPIADYAAFAPTATYRIYQGGPTYTPVAITVNALDGTPSSPVVLGPTPANPLGIFYRDGDLDLMDNVRVTGTLVVTHNLELKGPGIEVHAVRPAAGSGAGGVSAATASLPAVICGNDLTIRREASLTATGLIYAEHKVTREDLDVEAGLSVSVSGAVATGYMELATPPKWKALSGADWDRQDAACPAGTAFLPWLANAGNWPLLFWPLSYNLNGLSSQPSFTVTRPADAHYSLSPPLFRPDPAAWNAGGGYRWAVLAWGQSP